MNRIMEVIQEAEALGDQFEVGTTLMAALEARFAPPSWVCFQEVGNATGAGCSRHADLVAMNLWPSRGLEIVGVEVKTSRTDWVRELKNPAKAEAVMTFCDKWYLAVSDAKIVQSGELPPTWGLLEFNGKKMIERVPAAKLEPKPVTRGFMAAMLRKAAEYSPGKKELAAASEKARVQSFKDGVEHGERQAKHAKEQLDRLVREVEAFNKASGLSLSEYADGHELGEVVALVRKITNGRGSRSLMNSLRAEVRSVREHADAIEKAAEAIDSVIHKNKGITQ